MTSDIKNVIDRVRKAQFLQAYVREDGGVFVTEVAIWAADRDALLRHIDQLESAAPKSEASLIRSMSD
jgi:hypothetical protein